MARGPVPRGPGENGARSPVAGGDGARSRPERGGEGARGGEGPGWWGAAGMRRPTPVPARRPLPSWGRAPPGTGTAACQPALLPVGMVMGVVFPEEPLFRKSIAIARTNWSNM